MSATLECFGSGSSGNSYAIECDDEILLIELGIGWNDIMKGLEFNKGFRKVVGCIASHKHFDHIKPNTLNHALKRGVQVYSCQEVCDMYKEVKLAPKNEITHIGGFSVQPLPLPHNAENYGYIIKHPAMGKLVFATDCSDFKYKIKNVNHWMIEANYSEEIIINNIVNDTYSMSASENHLSIDQCIEALNVNISASLQTIILIHLSNGNSNEVQFIQDTKDELAFDNVYAAKKGLTVDLNKEEF